MSPLCTCNRPECRNDHSEPIDLRPDLVQIWVSGSELFAPPVNDNFGVE